MIVSLTFLTLNFHYWKNKDEIMPGIPQWIKNYVKHNAFSMTQAEMIKALRIKNTVLMEIINELGVECKKDDGKQLSFITKEHTCINGTYLSRLDILIQLRMMELHGNTVEEIATALMLSINTVKAKLKMHSLPVIKKKGQLPPPVSNNKTRLKVINDFITENNATMYVEDMATALEINVYKMAEKIRKNGFKPKWKGISGFKVYKRKPVVPEAEIKTPMIRPAAVYSNTTPYGIANHFNK